MLVIEPGKVLLGYSFFEENYSHVSRRDIKDTGIPIDFKITFFVASDNYLQSGEFIECFSYIRYVVDRDEKDDLVHEVEVEQDILEPQNLKHEIEFELDIPLHGSSMINEENGVFAGFSFFKLNKNKVNSVVCSFDKNSYMFEHDKICEIETCSLDLENMELS